MNSEYEQYKMDGLHEECGVFGMYDLDGGDVASSIYYGLFSLQHRGQESCGIAVSDTNGPKRKVDVQKGMGLVNEVFDEENLSKLKGNIGVGHVRYSTAGASNSQNVQPLVLNYVKGTLMLAHNGNLVNAHKLREEMEYTDRYGSDRVSDRARTPSYADGRGGGKKCDDETAGSVFPDHLESA